jgi:hypothetical protein
MIKIIASCTTFVLMVTLVVPFIYDAYARYEVVHKLAPVLSEQDKSAFRAWNGDAASFAKSLYARCELVHGSGGAACEPYRLDVE